LSHFGAGVVQATFTGQEYDEETNIQYFGARYLDNEIGRFISMDPWNGDQSNPQTLNKYSYALNNPVIIVDPTGLRPITEHEARVSDQLQYLQDNPVDNLDDVGLYQNARETYTSIIDSLPEDGDPEWFTIMNDAMFKWYDNQMGYTDWARSSGVESDYYTDSDPGDYKCNFFVGETLKDSVNYKNDMHGWFGKNPPIASDWVNNKVKGFSSVDSPNSGDVVSFDLSGSTDHSGIVLGNGMYISVTDSDGRNGRIEEGIRIKYIPYASFGTGEINFNRLNN